MTDDNDVELAGSIGRSTTKQPVDMTKREISGKFTYGSMNTWYGNSCYYEVEELRGHENYLGFKHNATGIIFGFTNEYRKSMGKVVAYLDGTCSESFIWGSGKGEYGFDKMMDEINAIDSKLSNWNVIRMEVRDEVKKYFHSLYIMSHSNYTMCKGDLSMIFKETDILQKGMVDVEGQYVHNKEKVKLETVSNMKEMIV